MSLLAFKNVSKTFRDGTQDIAVLADVSFEVDAGDYADGPLTSIDPTGECAVARTAALNSTAEECKQLRGSIEATARNLEKRLRQLRENKRGLSAAEVKNYVKTFEDKQQALRKKLKKWNFKNCSEEIGEIIPREVWQLTEIKVKATIKIVPVPEI
jgi:HAMP domain-containing protein